MVVFGLREEKFCGLAIFIGTMTKFSLLYHSFLLTCVINLSVVVHAASVGSVLLKPVLHLLERSRESFVIN